MKLLRSFLAGASMLAATSIHAATFTVTTIDDSGPGSLRQAILDANAAAAGGDSITFATNGTITLLSALPPITDNLTIAGPGTNLLTISGNNTVQVFTIAAQASDTMSDLTIANGLATGDANGAGIANAGSLAVSNCFLLNNQNHGGWGGAVFNSGNLKVVACTFSTNGVIGEAGQGGGWNTHYSCGGAMGCGGGGGAGMGGAIFSTSRTALILNCNFIGNSAIGGNGGYFRDDGCGRGGGANGGAGNFSAFGIAQDGGFGGGGGGGDAYGFPGHGGSGGFGGGSGGTGSGAGPGNGGGGSGIGGAIFLDTGALTIINCGFAANQVGGPGAAGPDFFNRAGIVLPALSTDTLGGGTVTADPSNPPYLNNSVATVTAAPAPGWNLLQWLGDASGTDQTLTVTVIRNKCLEAVFATTMSASALVSVDPKADFYPYGTVVKFTAVPPPGTYFASWSGDASGMDNPLRFAVTNPNPSVSCLLGTLGAGQFGLTVVEDGRGHVVKSPISSYYTNGQTITLTAVPDPGQDFVEWTGDADGAQNPLQTVMSASKVINATFTTRPSLRVSTCLEGLVEDGFRLTVLGEFGTVYDIPASTNLSEWTVAGSVTNTYGTVQFTDPQGTSLPHRFYGATPR